MHDLEHCFQPGGGMEGQKPEWMVQCDKVRRTARPAQSNPAMANQLIAASAVKWNLDANLSCAAAEGPELALLANHAMQFILCFSRHS